MKDFSQGTLLILKGNLAVRVQAFIKICVFPVYRLKFSSWVSKKEYIFLLTVLEKYTIIL